MVRRQELSSLYRDRSGASEGVDFGLIGGLLVITALALMDLVTIIDLLGALVVGSMVAAALSTPLRTVAVSFYGVAWALVLGAPDHWTAAHFLRLGLNIAGGAIGYSIAMLRVTREESLRRMIRIAEIAQQAVLRPLPDVLVEAELALPALRCRPSPWPLASASSSTRMGRPSAATPKEPFSTSSEAFGSPSRPPTWAPPSTPSSRI